MYYAIQSLRGASIDNLALLARIVTRKMQAINYLGINRCVRPDPGRAPLWFDSRKRPLNPGILGGRLREVRLLASFCSTDDIWAKQFIHHHQPTALQSITTFLHAFRSCTMLRMSSGVGSYAWLSTLAMGKGVPVDQFILCSLVNIETGAFYPNRN